MKSKKSLKIAFPYRGYEALGIESLSSILKKYGHKTKLIFEPALFADFLFPFPPLGRFFYSQEFLLKKILKFDPDLVAFSVVTNDFAWCCEFAGLIKKEINVPIVFGGPHPTSVPEITLNKDYVDFVIIGDGEYPLLELVSALSLQENDFPIKNVWYRKNGEIVKNPLRPLFDNFENLPHIDKNLYFEENQLFKIGYITMIGRGCVNRCSYCFNSYLKNLYKAPKYIYRRRIEDVIEELKNAKRQLAPKYVRFIDDNFAAEEEWFKLFCEEYKKEIDLPYWCLVHPNTISKEIVECLKASNCKEVQMGIQTTNEELKKNIIGRDESNEQIKMAIKYFREAKIRVSTDIILSLPGQTSKDLEYAAKFFSESKPTRINLYWLLFNPNTDITKRCFEKGELTQEDIEKINNGGKIRPIHWGGQTFNRKFCRFITFFIVLQLFPERVLKYFVKIKIYNYLPFFGLHLSFFLNYGLSYITFKQTNDLLLKRGIKRYIFYSMELIRFKIKGEFNEKGKKVDKINSNF